MNERINVTHHAALRWLDRIENIGAEHVRQRDGFHADDDVGVLKHLCRIYGHTLEELQRQIAALIPPDAVNGTFDVGGAHLAILNGVVITVFDDAYVRNAVNRRRREKKKQRVKNRARKLGHIERQGWHDE